jgi:putative aminopeptidase FrvX
VVSEITDDGYLRLHDPAAPARQHPLWDQFHLGQRVRVAVDAGPVDPQSYPGPGVPGVVGVRSTHLTRRRQADSAVATVDEFYVDVGARTRAEALALGVRPLAAVAREWRPVVYAPSLSGDRTVDGWTAAPAAARRAGCAVLAQAAAATPTAGRTTFVAAAQSAYGSSGLAAVLARLGPVDSLYVLDAGPLAGEPVDTAAVTRAPARTPLRVPGRPPVTPVAPATAVRWSRACARPTSARSGTRSRAPPASARPRSAEAWTGRPAGRLRT